MISEGNHSSVVYVTSSGPAGPTRLPPPNPRRQNAEEPLLPSLCFQPLEGPDSRRRHACLPTCSPSRGHNVRVHVAVILGVQGPTGCEPEGQKYASSTDGPGGETHPSLNVPLVI